MNIGDNYIVTIDKLGNLCVGLAKINDFLVMVDDVCPLDKVKIEITKLTKKLIINNIRFITKMVLIDFQTKIQFCAKGICYASIPVS